MHTANHKSVARLLWLSALDIPLVFKCHLGQLARGLGQLAGRLEGRFCRPCCFRKGHMRPLNESGRRLCDQIPEHLLEPIAFLPNQAKVQRLKD